MAENTSMTFDEVKKLSLEFKNVQEGIEGECEHLVEVLRRQVREEEGKDVLVVHVVDALVKELDNAIKDENKPVIADVLMRLNDMITGFHTEGWVCEEEQPSVVLKVGILNMEDLQELSQDLKIMRDKLNKGLTTGGNIDGWHNVLQSGEEAWDDLQETEHISERDISPSNNHNYCALVAFAKANNQITELKEMDHRLTDPNVWQHLMDQLAIAEGEPERGLKGFGRDMANKFQVDYVFILALFIVTNNLDFDEVLKAIRLLGAITAKKPLSKDRLSGLLKSPALAMFADIPGVDLGFHSNPFILNKQRLSVVVALFSEGVSERVLSSADVATFIKGLLTCKRNNGFTLDVTPETSSAYEYLVYSALTVADIYSLSKNRTPVRRSGLETVEIDLESDQGEGKGDGQGPDGGPKPGDQPHDFGSRGSFNPFTAFPGLPNPIYSFQNVSTPILPTGSLGGLASALQLPSNTPISYKIDNFKGEVTEELVKGGIRMRHTSGPKGVSVEIDKEGEPKETGADSKVVPSDGRAVRPKDKTQSGKSEKVKDSDKDRAGGKVSGKQRGKDTETGEIEPRFKEGSIKGKSRGVAYTGLPNNVLTQADFKVIQHETGVVQPLYQEDQGIALEGFLGWSPPANLNQGVFDPGAGKVSNTAFIDIEGPPDNPVEIALGFVCEDTSHQDFMYFRIFHLATGFTSHCGTHCHGLTKASVKGSPYLMTKEESPTPIIQKLLQEAKITRLVCHDSKDIIQWANGRNIKLAIVDMKLPEWKIRAKLPPTVPTLQSATTKCGYHDASKATGEGHTMKMYPHCAMSDCLLNCRLLQVYRAAKGAK